MLNEETPGTAVAGTEEEQKVTPESKEVKSYTMTDSDLDRFATKVTGTVTKNLNKQWEQKLKEREAELSGEPEKIDKMWKDKYEARERDIQMELNQKELAAKTVKAYAELGLTDLAELINSDLSDFDNRLTLAKSIDKIIKNRQQDDKDKFMNTKKDTLVNGKKPTGRAQVNAVTGAISAPYKFK